MSGGRRGRLGALVALFVAATLGVVISIANVPRLESGDVGFFAVLLGGLAIYLSLGVVIVVRADGHRIGWILSTSAAMVAVVFACWVGSFAVLEHGGSPEVAGWLNLAGSMLFTPAMILLIPAVALLFPTGDLPGPRWRRAVVVIAIIAAIGSMAVLINPVTQEGDPPNPVGYWFDWLPPDALRWVGVLSGFGTLAIGLALLLGVVAIATRFRSSSGAQRAQLKWLLAASVPAAILIPLSLSDIGAVIPSIDVISTATLVLVALAVALAILRYRLYEIDRIISRTIGWTVVTVVVVGAFIVSVLALQTAMSGFTQGQTLAVAASTLGAFAIFQPIRRRIQRAVDQQFDRAGYDALRIAEAFSERLRDEVDLPTLAGDLDATVRDTVAPSRLGLWLRHADR